MMSDLTLDQIIMIFHWLIVSKTFLSHKIR
jgi:hypothetical protein